MPHLKKIFHHTTSSYSAFNNCVTDGLNVILVLNFIFHIGRELFKLLANQKEEDDIFSLWTLIPALVLGVFLASAAFIIFYNFNFKTSTENDTQNKLLPQQTKNNKKINSLQKDELHNHNKAKIYLSNAWKAMSAVYEKCRKPLIYSYFVYGLLDVWSTMYSLTLSANDLFDTEITPFSQFMTMTVAGFPIYLCYLPSILQKVYPTYPEHILQTKLLKLLAKNPQKTVGISIASEASIDACNFLGTIPPNLLSTLLKQYPLPTIGFLFLSSGYNFLTSVIELYTLEGGNIKSLCSKANNPSLIQEQDDVSDSVITFNAIIPYLFTKGAIISANTQYAVSQLRPFSDIGGKLLKLDLSTQLAILTPLFIANLTAQFDVEAIPSLKRIQRNNTKYTCLSTLITCFKPATPSCELSAVNNNDSEKIAYEEIPDHSV